MAKRNAFLTRMQAAHEREAKTSIVLAEKWTRQAACDALILLLGYGSIMGKTRWGKKKILKAVNEWTELFLWVLRELQGYPDSDAIREQVDKLLQPKVMEELYRDWDGRYPGWIHETMEQEKGAEAVVVTLLNSYLNPENEQEVNRLRPAWKRDGELTDDPVTSKLLKGVGKDGR